MSEDLSAVLEATARLPAADLERLLALAALARRFVAVHEEINALPPDEGHWVERLVDTLLERYALNDQRDAAARATSEQ